MPGLPCAREGSDGGARRGTRRARLNSFPAIDGDTLLVGAGTTGFFKRPRFELVAYTLGSSRTRPSAPAGAATTIRVGGEEFGFRLSRMRSAGSRAAQA